MTCGAQLRSAMYHPSDDGCALTVDERNVRVWSLSEGAAQCVQTHDADELHSFWGATWAHGNPDSLATCGGNSLQLWDLRSQAKVSSIANAHRSPIRDVDFSKQHDFHVSQLHACPTRSKSGLTFLFAVKTATG